MSEYKYDATGATFVYFFFILFLSLMIAYTYFLFGGKKGKFNKVREHNYNVTQLCNCSACNTTLEKKKKTSKESTEPRINLRTFTLACGWILVSYLLYLVITIPSSEHGSAFNPYEVLGVPEGMSMDAIAKVRKRLAYEWHPDKAVTKGVDLNVAEERFAAINKAWETLNNPEARRNWEEWGDPDGRQPLPKWLVEEKNNNIVLGAYILVVIILVPILIKRWWAKLKKLSSSQDLNSKSLSILVRSVKGSSSVTQMLDEFINLPDFNDVIVNGTPRHPGVQQLHKEIKEKTTGNIHDIWAIPNVVSEKDFTSYLASVYIHSYLLRIKSDCNEINEDIENTIKMLDKIIETAISMAVSKCNCKFTISLMELSQLISQAVYPGLPSGMQLPSVCEELYQRKKTKKFKMMSISDYASLSDEQLETRLSHLSPELITEFKAVLHNIPVVEITDVKFEVPGESDITADSRVAMTLRVSFNTLISKRNNIVRSLNAVFLPHCPRHPTKKTLHWMCILSSPKYTGIFSTVKFSFTSNELGITLYFFTPKEPTRIPIRIDIMSDVYMDTSFSKIYYLTTVPCKTAEELPTQQRKPPHKDKTNDPAGRSTPPQSSSKKPEQNSDFEDSTSTECSSEYDLSESS